MLPNHSPLVIAEQFGTLESLYPGASISAWGEPGSDQRTAQALRRNLASDAEEFPRDVMELADYFSAEPRQAVRAVPGTGLNVPLWILGSSLFGAQVAAALGFPMPSPRILPGPDDGGDCHLPAQFRPSGNSSGLT